MTRAELNTLIDNNITNKTAPNSITPQNEGDSIKAVADYVDEKIGGTPLSQQVNVSTGSKEIKTIKFVRFFATDDSQECTLTGPHTVGTEYYLKNTTAFYVDVFGVAENINGQQKLTLAPNTYWHLVKEDSSTNSITAFKLSTT